MKIPCELCKGEGSLPLGSDRLECPHCEGGGWLEVETHRVQARTRTVYIPGVKPFETIDLPQRSLVTDKPIRRT